MEPLTPDMLLAAYANGYFPMALAGDDPELYWFSPEERGVLPLDTFNVPRGLARAMKKHAYSVTVDQDFEAVIRACGTLTKGREETWINATIVELYTELFRAGHAHSIEVWADGDAGTGGKPSPLAGEGLDEGAAKVGAHSPRPLTPSLSRKGRGGSPAAALVQNSNRELVGGLYGVSIGGAFFGESMFSRAPDASKIALVRLVEILREAGYELLDTQYVNEHLKQFGVEAWKKQDYMIKLEKALKASPNPSTRFSTASVRSGAASSSSESST